MEEVGPLLDSADHLIDEYILAQKMTSVEYLARELGHDLRNGLAALAGKVFQLGQGISKDEARNRAEDMHAILKELEKMASRLQSFGDDKQWLRHSEVARRILSNRELFGADHKELLTSSLLFQGLGEERRRDLAALGKLRQFRRNEMLFMAKNRVDHFFFILSGKVKEYYIGEDGEEYVIRISRPGEYLGLPALFLPDGYHTSFAEAVCPLTAASFCVPSFLSIAGHDPALNRNLLTLMSCRLECTRRQRCFDQKMTAMCRVANYLLDQTDGRFMETGCSCKVCCCQRINLLPLNLSAREIGLARETLTRILSRLKQEGVIDLDRGHVQLLDRQALEDLARC
jgi:CRP-like cAMP-binding protein